MLCHSLVFGCHYPTCWIGKALVITVSLPQLQPCCSPVISGTVLFILLFCHCPINWTGTALVIALSLLCLLHCHCPNYWSCSPLVTALPLPWLSYSHCQSYCIIMALIVTDTTFYHSSTTLSPSPLSLSPPQSSFHHHFSYLPITTLVNIFSLLIQYRSSSWNMVNSHYTP